MNRSNISLIGVVTFSYHILWTKGVQFYSITKFRLYFNCHVHNANTLSVYAGGRVALFPGSDILAVHSWDKP